MQAGSFENIVWYLNILAELVLIMRLWPQRQEESFRALLAYLFFDVVEDLLNLVFSTLGNHAAYYRTYLVGQTVKVIVAVIIARELFPLALARQPALASFGRRIIGYIFGFAALAGALNLIFAPATATRNYFAVSGFLGFESSIDLAVLIVLLLMSGFLLWFPVRTPRNVAVCIGGFMVYSFQRWAGLLLLRIWPYHRSSLSAAMLCVSFAVLAAWIILLSKPKDNTTIITGHRWNPEEVRRLTDQLDAINARLRDSEKNNVTISN